MNVALTVIVVLEIAAKFTQTGAFPNWSWGAKDKHKWWSHHHSETYHSCATGQCVKEWKCSEPAIVTYSEKDSCTYRENGPWVCCLVDDDNPYHWDNTNIETPDNFKRTTIKPQKVSTSSSTDKHWHDKYDGTLTPILKEFRNRNEEELSNIKPLRDMKNDRENYPFYRPRNKTIERTSVTNSVDESYKKSSTSTNYKRTTNAWDKSHTSTSSPQYYKRTTNKPRTSSTNYLQKTTHSWDRPRVSESRIFPIEKDKKYLTSSPPTKRSGPQSTTTKAAWEYTTAHTKRSISTTTKNPSSMKSAVSTKASTQGWNQNWGRSTTAHPARSQTTNPKATRPSSTRFTTISTRRYSVTTPLPNVNIYLCGIREERTSIRRQTRDANHRRNPVVDDVHSGNSRSRGRLPYQRIVGGEEAEPFSWPWVAALYKVTPSGGNRFLSAGSLINENFILTAAHVFTPDDLRTASYVVMLGTHDAQDAVAQYIVSSVLLHPKYEHRYYYNDIALLKLKRKVLFNNYIMPVCLPSPTAPLHSDKDLLGKKVTVMGWGDESFGGKSSQVLKEASFSILSRVSCNASYVRVESNRFPKGITGQMLCAGDPKGGKDACQGDSGGPLTVIENGRYTQVGIVSFGYKCGDKEFPGVYTKVAPYLSWIAENTRYVDGSTDYEYY